MNIAKNMIRTMQDRGLGTEMLRFLLVGGGATLLDLTVFRILQRGFALNPTLCFIAAFTTSVVCRFLADKFFTFRNAEAAYGRQFVLYVCACCITLLVGLLMFEMLKYFTGMPFLSKIISVPFVTLAGYILFRRIVFRA